MNRPIVGRPSLIWMVWALLGASIVAVLYWGYRLEGQPVPELGLVAWLFVWLLWIPVAHGVREVVARLPLDALKWRSRGLLYVGGGALLVALLFALRIGVDSFLHQLFDGPFLHGARGRAFFLQSLVFDAFVYLGIVAVSHAADYYRRYSERKLESVELETRLAQSQLRFMKAQLHPHFLFNSLNMISALMHEDVERADSVMADLSDLLRIALEQSEQQEVPLRRELEFLDRYLGIARARFGRRLVVDRRISGDVLDATVPNLLLQPLVENALHHGIQRTESVGRLTLIAARRGESVRFEVHDNGPGLPPGVPRGEGVGLSNTQHRLRQLYGADHHFELRNRPGGGAVAVVELPYRVADDFDPDRTEILDDYSYVDRRRRAAGA